LTQNTQINHADIVQHVTAVNRIFADPNIARFWNPFTAAGRAALDAMITQQARIIAYIDDYKLLMIATLLVIPRSSFSSGRPPATVLVIRWEWNEDRRPVAWP
jgi:MFS transporter, DHA2 family, multidrug resistance protein